MIIVNALIISGLMLCFMVTFGLGYKLESHLLALAFVAQRRVGSVPPPPPPGVSDGAEGCLHILFYYLCKL